MNLTNLGKIACTGLLLSLAALITSCETTGDPTQGALFGWSEEKAQARLNQRRGQLGHTQRSTEAVNESNWKLHAQKENLR